MGVPQRCGRGPCCNRGPMAGPAGRGAGALRAGSWKRVGGGRAKTRIFFSPSGVVTKKGGGRTPSKTQNRPPAKPLAGGRPAWPTSSTPSPSSPRSTTPTQYRGGNRLHLRVGHFVNAPPLGSAKASKCAGQAGESAGDQTAVR